MYFIHSFIHSLIDLVIHLLIILDSSFGQYKDFAGIRRGSREKRLQTTVGSRVMRASIALHAEVYALFA